MGNDRLRNAMAVAQVDVRTIAEKTGVDPKTVQRWISGRAPHARHRWIIAKLLKEREDFLWPSKEQESNIAQTAEIVAAYAHRSDVESKEWWRLLCKAEEKIDLLGYAMHFLPELLPELPQMLYEKGQKGCQIRICIGEPDSQQVRDRDEEEELGGTLAARIRATLQRFRPMWDCVGVEIRLHRTPLYNSIFRSDGEMFVTPHLYALHGSKAPLLYLRRLGPKGVFANFEAHFDAIWQKGVPATKLALAGK